MQKGMGALQQAAALAEQGGKGAQAIIEADEA
jgi:hypothetical protein